MSGGHGREGYDEPSIMRRDLEAQGIPHDAIFEDLGGANTWDTAKDAAVFLRQHHLHSVFIITQYFHMPRCRMAFARVGIALVYWSHAPFWSFRDAYSVPREVFGLIEYFFRPAASAA